MRSSRWLCTCSLRGKGSWLLSRMGKVPIRLKEVVYTISPFEVTVMSGLFKDMPKKFADKIKHVSLLPQSLT